MQPNRSNPVVSNRRVFSAFIALRATEENPAKGYKQNGRLQIHAGSLFNQVPIINGGAGAFEKML
jgi:hypothetical protein